MLLDYQAKFTATELPPAVLRKMWDELSRDTRIARDAKAAAAEAAAAEKKRAEQADLAEQWVEKAAGPPIKVISERWEQLELNGKPVIVHPTAEKALLEKLYTELKALDPNYDRSYSAIKDLAKMPVISELLADPKHCLNTSYLFELYSCGDPACKYGCEAWPEAEEGSAEAALQAELKKATPLARLSKDGESHLSYEASCRLSENDERDLPSCKRNAPKELLKKRAAADKVLSKTGVFANSKVRDSITCDECGRPRLIFSMTLPRSERARKKLLDALDGYKEGVDFVCGRCALRPGRGGGWRRDAQAAGRDLPRQAGAHMPRHGRAQLLQLRKRPRRHRV